MNEIRNTGPTEDLARAERIQEAPSERLTFALMLPIAVAVGLFAGSAFVGAAWRVFTWAAGL